MVTLRLAAALFLLWTSPALAGTVSGKLAPGTAKLPKSASTGRAQVLALNIDTMAYGAAAPVARNGKYSLSNLPAGKWALRTSVVALGRPFAAFTSAAIVTKPGQRRSVPLTLKRSKKPRKKKKVRRPHTANINPKDGQAYAGEAIAIEPFLVVGGDASLAGIGKGMGVMQGTELLTKPLCAYTIVEWSRRAEIEREIALSQTEYIDPATKIEEGHLIDPEIIVKGRVEDRPGTPGRVAMIAWLVDAKTGARLSGDVSSVMLDDAVFANVRRLGQLIMRDLICARAKKPAPVTTTPAAPAPPPPSPPVPAAATNVYTGTFSGEAYSEAAFVRQTWNGTIRLDAAQDSAPPVPPPNGAPAGSYRTFTATSGSVDVTIEGRFPGNCALDGTGHIDLIPGFINQLIVQLDVPNPAYVLAFTGLPTDVVQVTRSGGPGCSGTSPFPVFSPWASTGMLAHTAPSFALSDFQAVLTPEAPFDYDYTTRWSLSPG